MVLNFDHLLSAVVYSYAFKFHLKLLGVANLLRVTSQLYLSDLLTFAKQYSISYMNPLCPPKMKAIIDEVDQELVDQEPTNEEAMGSLDTHLSFDHLASVFCNQFRLFVGHFGAKHILKKYSEKLAAPVEIKLLGIKLAPCEHPLWIYLKDTMKLALQHHGHKLDLDSTDSSSLGSVSDAKPLPNEPRHDAGQFLGKQHLSANKKQFSIIKKFWVDVHKLHGHSSFIQVRRIASESLTNQLLPYYLSLHCETILASLAALYYTQDLENNEELDCILKVYLVVSKKNESCADCLCRT